MMDLKEKVLTTVKDKFGSVGVSAVIEACSTLVCESSDTFECIDAINEISHLDGDMIDD